MAGTKGRSGRKKNPDPATLKMATRKNVSLDETAALALVGVQQRLEGKLGFRPTLTQTVLWLIAEEEARGKAGSN